MLGTGASFLLIPRTTNHYFLGTSFCSVVWWWSEDILAILRGGVQIWLRIQEK